MCVRLKALKRSGVAPCSQVWVESLWKDPWVMAQEQEQMTQNWQGMPEKFFFEMHDASLDFQCLWWWNDKCCFGHENWHTITNLFTPKISFSIEHCTKGSRIFLSMHGWKLNSKLFLPIHASLCFWAFLSVKNQMCMSLHAIVKNGVPASPNGTSNKRQMIQRVFWNTAAKWSTAFLHPTLLMSGARTSTTAPKRLDIFWQAATNLKNWPFSLHCCISMLLMYTQESACSCTNGKQVQLLLEHEKLSFSFCNICKAAVGIGQVFFACCTVTFLFSVKNNAEILAIEKCPLLALKWTSNISHLKSATLQVNFL